VDHGERVYSIPMRLRRRSTHIGMQKTGVPAPVETFDENGGAVETDVELRRSPAMQPNCCGKGLNPSAPECGKSLVFEEGCVKLHAAGIRSVERATGERGQVPVSSGRHARVLFSALMDPERRAVVAAKAPGAFDPVILEDVLRPSVRAVGSAEVLVCTGPSARSCLPTWHRGLPASG